jgi:hypothetical protein
MLVGLAFFTVRQSQAQVAERTQISQLHSELAVLKASLMAESATDQATSSAVASNPPEVGWRCGVGDTLVVVDSLSPVTFGQSSPIQVEPDGKTLLPDVGWVTVADRSRAELEDHLLELYK